MVSKLKSLSCKRQIKEAENYIKSISEFGSVTSKDVSDLKALVYLLNHSFDRAAEAVNGSERWTNIIKQKESEYKEALSEKYYELARKYDSDGDYKNNHVISNIDNTYVGRVEISKDIATEFLCRSRNVRDRFF